MIFKHTVDNLVKNVSNRHTYIYIYIYIYIIFRYTMESTYVK